MTLPNIAIGSFVRTPVGKEGVVTESYVDGRVRLYLLDKQKICVSDNCTILPNPSEDLSLIPGKY